MACKDLALKAIDNLLSRLKLNDPKTEAASKINTRLIVRQTTGLPKNALSDLSIKTVSTPRSR
jgi:LacI family transcriptional regulator